MQRNPCVNFQVFPRAFWTNYHRVKCLYQSYQYTIHSRVFGSYDPEEASRIYGFYRLLLYIFLEILCYWLFFGLLNVEG
jgi:hypothetical protein